MTSWDDSGAGLPMPGAGCRSLPAYGRGGRVPAESCVPLVKGRFAGLPQFVATQRWPTAHLSRSAA